MPSDIFSRPSAKRARKEELAPLDDRGGSPSETEILRLVADREAARQARRFDEADDVRDHLRRLGVELFDKDKEWSCSDGRRGSMFTAGPSECLLSGSEIQVRVQRREDARKVKDWDMADRLREELRGHGIELNDKEMTWRTSTGRQGTYTGTPTAAQMPGSAIRMMIAERERHRAAQDFESADDVRRELQAIGVEVYDNERLWRCTDGRQGFIITGGAEVDCFLTDRDIQARVAEREEMRAMKDWNRADAIRDELRRLGCELLDTQKMWCTTDGRSGSYSSAPAVPQLSAPASRTTQSSARETTVALAQAAAAQALKLAQARPIGNGSALPVAGGGPVGGGVFASKIEGSWSDASIKALTAGRERARERHEWAAADAIRADLRSHGVELWDKDKIWKAVDGRHGKIVR